MTMPRAGWGAAHRDPRGRAAPAPRAGAERGSELGKAEGGSEAGGVSGRQKTRPLAVSENNKKS